MTLPDALLDLLRKPSPCFIATTMPDGSPHLVQVWVTTDAEHIVINTVVGHRKVENIEKDPRVAINICDPAETSRYFAVRGHVLRSTTDGGADGIEELARKYLGGPYPWFGGRDQVRLVLTIAVDRIIHSPR